ncbi:MAG: hypothetical protein NTW08_05430 [Gammaproteobacteria bacterium]|nr:hypothetical protein [Gammaproteobacteria bacterium]
MTCAWFENGQLNPSLLETVAEGRINNMTDAKKMTEDPQQPSPEQLYDQIKSKNESGDVDFKSIFKELETSSSVTDKISGKSRAGKIVTGYAKSALEALNEIPLVKQAASVVLSAPRRCLEYAHYLPLRWDDSIHPMIEI